MRGMAGADDGDANGVARQQLAADEEQSRRVGQLAQQRGKAIVAFGKNAYLVPSASFQCRFDVDFLAIISLADAFAPPGTVAPALTN